MLHLVKPAEGDGLDILVSATAVPVDDERLRLAAVMRYEILDTAPEAACDRITALAADLFNVPISIIGFVDSDRIWFKSHHGLDSTEIERGEAQAVRPCYPRSGSRFRPARRPTSGRPTFDRPTFDPPNFAPSPPRTLWAKPGAGFASPCRCAPPTASISGRCA
jgi:hypothetical protein